MSLIMATILAFLSHVCVNDYTEDLSAIGRIEFRGLKFSTIGIVCAVVWLFLQFVIAPPYMWALSSNETLIFHGMVLCSLVGSLQPFWRNYKYTQLVIERFKEIRPIVEAYRDPRTRYELGKLSNQEREAEHRRLYIETELLKHHISDCDALGKEAWNNATKRESEDYADIKRDIEHALTAIVENINQLGKSYEVWKEMESYTVPIIDFGGKCKVLHIRGLIQWLVLTLPRVEYEVKVKNTHSGEELIFWPALELNRHELDMRENGFLQDVTVVVITQGAKEARVELW